jgi:hypothetical protein
MVYSPTTWGTDDVISSAKLNKIEQGVKTATLLSGTDIDVDKDWQGKAVSNMKSLETGTFDGVVPLPPEASHLHAVPVTSVSPAVIASGAGPYSPNYEGQALYSYTIPTNLAGYGVPASHGLVKLTVRYTYSSPNSVASAEVYVGGVICPPLTVSGDRTDTREYSLWAKTGATIVFYARGLHAGDQHTPTLSDISITLTDCFPANQILASDFGALVGLPGATITPYHLAGPAAVECTCNFDGPLVTMSDFAARPYFPLRPISVNLNWKSGYGWAADPPALTFYRGV